MSIVTHPNLYTVVEMTEAVEKLPAIPLLMARLFEVIGVTTTSVHLDIEEGQIVLVNNQDRRDPPQENHGRGSKGSAKILECAHLPLTDMVLPDDLQDVRSFGTTNPVTKETKINRKILTLKNSIAMTTEFHRLGAVKGIVYDSDGTTILHNLFSVFGCTKKSINLVFPSNTHKFNPILSGIRNAQRHAEDKLGGTPVQSFEAICGSTFFDMLTTHELVREAYALWSANQGNFGNDDIRRKGFTYGGVTWIEASKTVASRKLVDDAKAHMYPIGPGIFKQYQAPANWMETVNTEGLEFYARMDPIPHGRGQKLEVQSNPLTICTYPEALVELTASTGEVEV